MYCLEMRFKNIAIGGSAFKKHTILKIKLQF